MKVAECLGQPHPSNNDNNNNNHNKNNSNNNNVNNMIIDKNNANHYWCL